MKYEEYMNKREELANEAQGLLDEGKLEDAQSKMDAMTALDEQFENEAQKAAELRALEGNYRKINMNGAEVFTVDEKKVEEKKMDVKDLFKTEEYTNAWAKNLMKQQLTDQEAATFKMVNEAYTHNTTTTGQVIPETVANQIWDKIVEMFPFYADTYKTFIPGKAVLIRSTESSDADWYLEANATADGKELFKRIELNGCELSRAIKVTWLEQAMAIADFIPHIVRKMAQAMGRGLAYGVVNGAGAVEGAAPEPTGVLTELKKSENSAQVVGTAATALSYTNLLAARAAVNAGFKPTVYCNPKTMYVGLMGLVDTHNRPVVVQDVQAEGSLYRVLGCPVKCDDAFGDGEILFGDASAYQVNINKQITLDTEDHKRDRYTDYIGYAVVDGAPIDPKAFALLQCKVGE